MLQPVPRKCEVRWTWAKASWATRRHGGVTVLRVGGIEYG